MVVDDIHPCGVIWGDLIEDIDAFFNYRTSLAPQPVIDDL